MMNERTANFVPENWLIEVGNKSQEIHFTMETLLQQTELWQSMLHSPSDDPKEMLKVLTNIVTETVHIYSSQRYSFVLFTLLDHSNNALAHFQHLEHISGSAQFAQTNIQSPGSVSLPNTANLTKTNALPKGMDCRVTTCHNSEGSSDEVVKVQPAVVPQVEDVQCVSSLGDVDVHCELISESVVSSETLDSSFEDGAILEQQKGTVNLESHRNVVQMHTKEQNFAITTNIISSVIVDKRQPSKRVSTSREKKSLSKKGVTKQRNFPPKSLQAGCCIFCCEKISISSVKEHYLSSHMQQENDNFILKCQVCEQTYESSSPSFDIALSDLFIMIHSLEEHMASAHPMMSIYKCGECSFVTFSTEALASHSKSHDKFEDGASRNSSSQNHLIVEKSTEKSVRPSVIPSLSEDSPKLKTECMFCIDKANAPKQITATEFKKHILQHHIQQDGHNWKLQCPHCLIELRDSNINQLLCLSRNHINTEHGFSVANLPEFLHCKKCQLISTSTGTKCKHMEVMNSLKTAETYSEIEENEGLGGDRPVLLCFLCPEGVATMKTLEEVKMHFKSQHLRQLTPTSAGLICNLCSAQFPCPSDEGTEQLTYLIKTCAIHLSKVHDRPISQFFQRLKCPHCSYYSILKKDIWRHRQEKHTNSRVCDKCGKVLKVHSLMSSHRNFCKGNVNKKKYHCSSCDQLFCSSGARNRHFKVVHLKRQEHVCSYCHKKFSKRHNLQLHVLRCHKHNDSQKETEKCPVCGFVTFSGYQMENHLKSHVKGEFRCQHCEATFSTKRKLYHHVGITHRTRQLLQCEECKFRTREKATLIQHVNRIHRGMSLTCHICKYRALDETKLKAHMDSKHSGESESKTGSKSFPCCLCERVFSTKHRLETHSFNIHNLNVANKPVHQCNSCDYKAIEKSMLKIHVQNTHGNLAIFNCEICGRTFKSQGKLQNHKRRSHPVQNKYQCDVCSYVTDSKSQFVLHQSRKHTGKRMKCPVCKYATYQAHLYNRHMEQKHTKQEIQAHAALNEATSVLSHPSQESVVPGREGAPSLLTMSWHPERPNEVTVSSARNVRLVSQNPDLIGRTGSLCMRQTDLQLRKTATQAKQSIPALTSIIGDAINQQVATEPLKSLPEGAFIPAAQTMTLKPQTSSVANPSRTLINQHESFLQNLLAPSYWENASQ